VHKKLTVLTLLLMPLTEVTATEWTSIIKDAEHEVLVDIDSYNTSGGYPYLDAKITYYTPQSITLADQTVTYAMRIAKYQFNCTKPLYRMRTMQLMTEQNKTIDTIKISGSFNKLEQNTDAFSIGQLTCQVHQMLGG